MPELPEVEITRRGIAPHLPGRRITRVVVRERRLRWPVPHGLERRLAGRRALGAKRRGKYLLLELEGGWLILHLGMSGSLCVFPRATPPRRHDHLDLELTGDRLLRLHDPRRFGSVHWTTAPPCEHPLLRELGPEPLDPNPDPEHLVQRARGRRVSARDFLLNGRVIAGIGNIYANEALFEAGIHPGRQAGRISAARCRRLQQALRSVLRRAIAQGGTTLRDFRAGPGRPGYFRVSLQVYDRAGAPCPRCGQPIRARRIGQRSSYYCPRCQR